jgi:proteasome lid subunit RPN8/RPN11
MKRWHLFARQPSLTRSIDLTQRSGNTTPPVPTTLAAPPARPSVGLDRALPLFTRTQAQARSYCDELARSFLTDLDEADLDTLLALSETSAYHLGALTSARFALQQTTAETAKPSAASALSVPEYHVSAWFLSRSQAYLTSHPDGDERLHLVTGIQVAKRSRTLDHLIPVAQASQSATHAQADQQALLTVLAEMDAWGHTITALCHSHPGAGAGMTRPSGTDLATQERYEAGGYPLVSAICTRDGWFRFFAHHPFTIALYGKGVTQYEDHLFQIQSPARHLPHLPR